MERTLGIIKPDATQRNIIGEILARVEKAGLQLAAIKLLQLDTQKAEGFYKVHQDKPFFGSLVSFMTSGPVVVFVMEGKNAVIKWRETMGATNPEKADAGTIRKDFALDIEKNSVHGSDSSENAQIEIAYFFDKKEICSR